MSENPKPRERVESVNLDHLNLVKRVAVFQQTFLTEDEQMTTRFPIECTHCCVKLKVKQSVLGKTVKCPKCQKNFRAVAETDAVLTPEYETNQLLSYGDKKPKPPPLKSDGPIGENVDLVNMNSVSYTHLTLPTILLV